MGFACHCRLQRVTDWSLFPSHLGTRLSITVQSQQWRGDLGLSVGRLELAATVNFQDIQLFVMLYWSSLECVRYQYTRGRQGGETMCLVDKQVVHTVNYNTKQKVDLYQYTFWRYPFSTDTARLPMSISIVLLVDNNCCRPVNGNDENLNRPTYKGHRSRPCCRCRCKK